MTAITRQSVGLNETLLVLTEALRRTATEPVVAEMAQKLTHGTTTRGDRMRLLVDELHRRFTYVVDPLDGEVLRPVDVTDNKFIGDVDTACMFVAALAQSIGIPCRFVAARYGTAWTLRVAYEDDAGHWERIDVLRQAQAANREPDELFELAPRDVY